MNTSSENNSNNSSDVLELSKDQIEQSLMNRIRIFEEEVSWGIAPQELRGLTGRIGELYVAYATNGKLASRANQKGFDVRSEKNERISVKTRASSKRDYGIKESTSKFVDRVICLRITTNSENEIVINTELDVSATTFKKAENLKTDGKYRLTPSNVNEPLQYDTKWDEVTLRKL